MPRPFAQTRIPVPQWVSLLSAKEYRAPHSVQGHWALEIAWLLYPPTDTHTCIHTLSTSWTIYKASNQWKSTSSASRWFRLVWGPGLLRYSLQVAPTSSWITPILIPHRQDSAQSMPYKLPAACASWMVHNRTAAHVKADLFLVPGSFPALESPLRLLLLDAHTSSNHISSGDTTARPWISLWIPAKT
jgi:hypothetical protein